jgi:hypothetical protein
MTVYLRQSTASQEVPLGFFLDNSDGNTEETALTIANTDIKIWKAGSTTVVSKNSGGATHITKGIYYCTLDATDTDTLGSLLIFVHVTGALSVRQEFVVVTANWYDTMFSTDVLDTNVTTIAAGAITAAAIDTDAIDADAIKTDAITEIQSGLATASALSAAKTVVDAIKVVTDAQAATGTGLTAIPWNAAWDAEVQSEVADALAVYDPPTQAEIPTIAGIVDAVWDEVLHSDHEVASSASVALQAAGSAGDPWSTAIPGSYGAGTAGKIIGDNINAPVGTVDTVVDAIKALLDDVHDTDLPAVKTETAAIKAKTDNLPASPAAVGSNMGSA